MSNYNNPIITKWEVDENGDKVSVLVENETKQIIGNKIVLEGLPDEQYRVFIQNFVEINIKDKIVQPNQFKVDYKGSGLIFFHESLNGQWITVNAYRSKGMIYYPASRIWTHLSVDGEVIQTMDSAFNILDEQSNRIQSLEGVRVHEGVIAPTDTKFWYDPSDD